MATAEDYAGWLVQNQDKKGTPEFDTVAQAYKHVRGQPDMSKPVVAQNITPSMQSSLKDEAASRPSWEAGLAGVGTAVDNAAMRLKSLFTRLTPTDESNVRANRDLTSASGPALAGNIVGNVAMTGGPAAALYRGVAPLAARVLPGTVAPALAPTVAGAVTGGTTAALTNPVLSGESEAGNIAMGAAGGALGDTAARVASRAIQPIMQSAPVRALLAHDVVPTPGQAAGPNSFLGRLEQKAQSIFGVGDVINAGRNRAGVEFNRAAINQGVPQGQPAIQAIGDEGIAQLGDQAGRNYTRQLAGHTVQVDPAIVAAVDASARSTRLPLSQAGEGRFHDLINRLFYQRLPPSGSMPANELKAQIIGDIGHAAQQYRNSGDAEQRALGAALGNARNSIQQWMLRQTGAPAREIAMADTAYGAQKAVENAGDRALARGGEFNPLQLLRQANEGSATERLAQAGQAVLPGTVPNSGTIDRATLAALLGMGGAGANEYFGGPGYLSALALAPLAYGRAGSRYAIGDLIPGQQAGAALVRSGAPYAANAGSTLAEILRSHQNANPH